VGKERKDGLGILGRKARRIKEIGRKAGYGPESAEREEEVDAT
jgi:hypothetical protein